MTNKISRFYQAHKIISFLIIVILAGGSYYIYKSKTNSAGVTSYVLGRVEKGSILVAVSGSGQVTASSQVDITPKITANVAAINVKEGQAVKAGDVLARLDNQDLVSQARQAKNSLDISRANLNLKLAGPTAQDALIAKNSVDSAMADYTAAAANLPDVKKTADQNIKKAKLSLANAEVSANNAVNDYSNALSSGNISTDTDSQFLANAYDNAKPTISSVLINLRTALNAVDNILGIEHNTTAAYKYLLGVRSSQTVNDAANSFAAAKQSLSDFEKSYNSVSGSWTQTGEDELLNKTLQATQDMKTLVHNTYSVLLSTITGADLSQSTLDGYRSTIASQESSLVSNINSIQSAIQNISNAKLGVSSSGINTSGSVSKAKAAVETANNNLTTAQSNYDQAERDNQNNIDSAQANVEAKKIALANAQASYELKMAKPRLVDLAALNAQVSQAENAYLLAVDNLKNAQIISPIDGVAAKVYLNVGDSASAASPVVTVITPRQLAAISLNEVDAAKVKMGQKATLTFNAIDGLSITGTVANVDMIGTVSQNVVNYSAKIALDTQDERIKPQMSVTANIVVNEKLNTLIIPNSAVKTDNSGASYVEILNNPAAVPASGGNNEVTSANQPDRKNIEVGLVNDTDSEVLSGLKEGDQVIVRTNAAAANASSQATGGFRLFGGGGGGAGALRGTGR